MLLGKEERFKDSGMQLANVGPGSYSGFYRPSFKGGYMPRESRTSSRPEQLPGPGSYLSEM